MDVQVAYLVYRLDLVHVSGLSMFSRCLPMSVVSLHADQISLHWGSGGLYLLLTEVLVFCILETGYFASNTVRPFLLCEFNC